MRRNSGRDSAFGDLIENCGGDREDPGRLDIRRASSVASGAGPHFEVRGGDHHRQWTSSTAPLSSRPLGPTLYVGHAVAGPEDVRLSAERIDPPRRVQAFGGYLGERGRILPGTHLLLYEGHVNQSTIDGGPGVDGLLESPGQVGNQTLVRADWRRVIALKLDHTPGARWPTHERLPDTTRVGSDSPPAPSPDTAAGTPLLRLPVR